MQWMVSHQQARRNLTPGELIYANSMVADEIALENKERISKAVSESNRNRILKSNSVQMDGNEIKNKNGKLEQGLGMGSLVIRCDMNGQNYKLAVNGEPKSEFVIYRCPTCGCKLF